MVGLVTINPQAIKDLTTRAGGEELFENALGLLQSEQRRSPIVTAKEEEVGEKAAAGRIEDITANINKNTYKVLTRAQTAKERQPVAVMFGALSDLLEKTEEKLNSATELTTENTKRALNNQRDALKASMDYMRTAMGSKASELDDYHDKTRTDRLAMDLYNKQHNSESNSHNNAESKKEELKSKQDAYKVLQREHDLLKTGLQYFGNSHAKHSTARILHKYGSKEKAEEALHKMEGNMSLAAHELKDQEKTTREAQKAFGQEFAEAKKQAQKTVAEERALVEAKKRQDALYAQTHGKDEEAAKHALAEANKAKEHAHDVIVVEQKHNETQNKLSEEQATLHREEARLRTTGINQSAKHAVDAADRTANIADANKAVKNVKEEEKNIPAAGAKLTEYFNLCVEANKLAGQNEEAARQHAKEAAKTAANGTPAQLEQKIADVRDGNRVLEDAKRNELVGQKAGALASLQNANEKAPELYSGDVLKKQQADFADKRDAVNALTTGQDYAPIINAANDTNDQLKKRKETLDKYIDARVAVEKASGVTFDAESEKKFKENTLKGALTLDDNKLKDNTLALNTRAKDLTELKTAINQNVDAAATGMNQEQKENHKKALFAESAGMDSSIGLQTRIAIINSQTSNNPSMLAKVSPLPTNIKSAALAAVSGMGAIVSLTHSNIAGNGLATELGAVASTRAAPSGPRTGPSF